MPRAGKTKKARADKLSGRTVRIVKCGAMQNTHDTSEKNNPFCLCSIVKVDEPVKLGPRLFEIMDRNNKGEMECYEAGSFHFYGIEGWPRKIAHLSEITTDLKKKVVEEV